MVYVFLFVLNFLVTLCHVEAKFDCICVTVSRDFRC